MTDYWNSDEYKHLEPVLVVPNFQEFDRIGLIPSEEELKQLEHRRSMGLKRFTATPSKSIRGYNRTNPLIAQFQGEMEFENRNEEFEQYFLQFSSSAIHNKFQARQVWMETDSRINDVKQQWLYGFRDHGHTAEHNVSLTDIKFSIYLMMQRCVTGPLEPEVGLDSILQIRMKLSIASCRHVNYLSFPSEAEIKLFERQLASIYFKWLMIQGPYELAKLLEDKKPLTCSNEYIQTAFDLSFVLPRPGASYKERKGMILRQQEKPAFLFNPKPRHLAFSMLEMGSRVLGQWHMEHMLLHDFPENAKSEWYLTQLTPYMYQNVFDYITTRFTIRASSTFKQSMSQIAMELWLPMGARCSVWREVSASNSLLEPPLSVLERELGYDKANELEALIAELKDVQFEVIYKTPSHPYYFLLLLALIQQLIREETDSNIQFGQQYLIFPSCIMDLMVYELFHRLTRGGQAVERRPLITHLCGSWRIHFRRTWITCSSPVEAVLLWSYLMVHECEKMFETSHSIPNDITQWFHMTVDHTTNRPRYISRELAESTSLLTIHQQQPPPQPPPPMPSLGVPLEDLPPSLIPSVRRLSPNPLLQEEKQVEVEDEEVSSSSSFYDLFH